MRDVESLHNALTEATGYLQSLLWREWGNRDIGIRDDEGNFVDWATLLGIIYRTDTDVCNYGGQPCAQLHETGLVALYRRCRAVLSRCTGCDNA